MELITNYIGEIVLGSMGAFLSAGVAGYKSLMARIKKLEENQIVMRGDIKLNSALDKARAEK